MINYEHWVEQKLPHVIGADPDDGIGADCLVVAYKIRAAAGLLTPPLDSQWFTMASNGEWEALEREWRRLMEPCDPEPYAMCMNRNRTGFGVSIIVDGGVLCVHHRRGVQWVPLKLMPLQFWRPRIAAI